MKFESCCRLEKAKSLVRLVDLLDSSLPLGGKAHRKSHQSGELSGLTIGEKKHILSEIKIYWAGNFSRDQYLTW